MLHTNGCVSSSLADVFPSIPLQDLTVNGSINGPLIGVNGLGGVDIASRIKYLGLNLSSQLGPTSPADSSFFNEDRSRTNLIINYLPQSYDQNDLQRLFERVGPIRQCKLIRDKNTGASLCYGFVDFVNPQHAALAIQTYHGYETEQKRLRVAYASSGGRRFTPNHRLPALNIGNMSGCLGSDVTNENIIGWEVFVVGIPLEWTEPDLLRLFTNFGNVVLIRLLAPQLSESPPSHKPRLNSPVMNGITGELNQESVDCTRLTTTASVIFEEKSSAEQSVLRLNGYHAPDWAAPLRLRIIGSVTRETYGLFCFPSRHSPALGLSRIPNSQASHDPLSESDVLCNLLNKKTLPVPGCVSNTLDPTVLSASSDVGSNNYGLHPRAIIRNKVNDLSPNVLGQSNFLQATPMELLDLLDSHSSISNSTNSGLMNLTERIASRDVSLANSLSSHRAGEQENCKLDTTLRTLSTNQVHSPWSVTHHRSVLGALPDVGRASEALCHSWLSGSLKRLSIKTPVIPSPVLTGIASQRGCQAHIWLKLENVQPTGSFKIRGMENVCRKWASAGVTHVVCPSGGNAGIAAAYCAQAYGLTCTLVVPETNESVIRRRLALEAPETRIVVHGVDWLEANHRAEQMVNELQTGHSSDQSVRLLHPYDQPDLWEGYEAVVDELTPEIGQPDVIVVAVGGGGLLAGIIQGLWNRGWSSTHVVAIETEGADCLWRSMKAGQLLLVPRSTSIAASLVAPVLANRSWNLAQLQSLTPATCTDSEALNAVKHFLDDHGMLVEPASGAALCSIYSGIIGRLQLEGRIPRPASVVIIVGGGRNVSLRQLADWENQLNTFSSESLPTTFLPSITNPYLTRSSPHSVCPELICKQATAEFGQPMTQDPDETLKIVSSASSTPRATCAAISHASTSLDSTDLTVNSVMERNVTVDVAGALNPHDLVNFSKLLAPSDADVDDSGLRE
ncbi:unnamed protein product [Dicrocoelium dendriticum]|nr:unnamed protein product [Dicrocoelium dendriticum]